MAHKWKPERLPVSMIFEDAAFQPRAGGVDAKHVKKLAAVEGAGEVLPPVDVARIGDALYLVDGFHRMAVWRAAGAVVVGARVARMSRPAAVLYSLQANAKHGLNLKAKDKAAILQRYCSEGLHLRENGGRKPLDTIHQEIGMVYDRSHVRRKLIAAGLWDVEADDEPTWKSYRVDYDDDDDDSLGDLGGGDADLEAARLGEAMGAVATIRALRLAVGVKGRESLAVALRGLAVEVERGEAPEVPEALVPLDL